MVQRTYQDFVRALKSSSGQHDPVEGHSKFEIARDAWNSPYVQSSSKADFIVEYLLGVMLKSESESGPLLEIDHWTLLADILVPSESREDTRPLKTWLLPILHRIPFSSILIQFLDRVPEQSQDLTAVFEGCTRILWPLSVQKLSAEQLLGAFGAVLRASFRCKSNENLAGIGVLVTSSFRNALGNATNRKKVYNVFMQTHLRSWLLAISVQHLFLTDAFYAAGIETIFNSDILRQPLDIPFVELVDSHSSSFPCLLASYIEAVRKNRGTLFTGSKVNPMQEARRAGMNFFIACQKSLPTISHRSEIWRVRADLLKIVDAENLFLPQDGVAETEEIVKKNVSEAAAVLDIGDETIVVPAVELLCTVCSIDFDFIVPAWSGILPKLFLMPALPQYLRFLDLILDYHAKARTLNAYISTLYTGILSLRVQQNIYQVASTSPLMHFTHLDRLAGSVRTFVTPGQVMEVLSNGLACLDQFPLVGDAEEARTRKRRKLDGKATIDVLQSQEMQAIRYSLCTRILQIVLPSLPLGSVSPILRQEVEAIIFGACRKLFLTSRRLGSEGSQGQVFAAANLRLCYSLRDAWDSEWLATQELSAMCLKLFEMINEEDTLPELIFEGFRILLAVCANGKALDPTMFLDRLMGYITGCLDPAITWTGRACHLVSDRHGKQRCALALLQLVVTHWLSLMDRFASPDSLVSFINLMLKIGLPTTNDANDEVAPKFVVLTALRSAEFWEMHGIRAALLSRFDVMTASLDSINARGVLAGEIVPPMDSVDTIVTAYQLLLYVPIDYITRTSRTDLVRRAMICDAVLVNSTSSENTSWALGSVRIFMRRVWEWVGAVDHPVRTVVPDFLMHLLKRCSSHPTAELVKVTVDLIEGHLARLTKYSPEELLPFIESYSLAELHQDTDVGMYEITQAAFGKLVEVLRRNSTPTSLPKEIQLELVKLQREHSERLLPLIRSGLSSKDKSSHRILLHTWRHCLMLGRWLGVNASVCARLAQRQVSAILSSRMDSQAQTEYIDIAAVTLSLLFEEMYSADTDHFEHLGIIVASYLALSRVLGTNGDNQFHEHISLAGKDLSPGEFSHISELIIEHLAQTPWNAEDDAICLIQFCGMLLRHTPEGTLKISQAFASQALNLFANRSIFSMGSLRLRLRVLEFVSAYCCDRPTALQMQDRDNIWSLLAKCLQKSSTHDTETSPTTFHAIVMIVGALVRLRRDLVMHTLPHLSHVLRRLISCLRTLRPQLGGKQTRLVTDSLPIWIHAPSHPLSAQEARAVARLLTALTTKTILRPPTRARGVEPERAESLAKPFAKHAAHVLKAYIDVVNDPLCAVPLEMRRELQPGLFSLCEILDEHDRDAMMVSALDAGGKATMKALWQEYEKQRYVGKG